MPEHWQETTLGEIADLEIGKTPPRNASQYWTDSLERPFCTIADMDGHVIKPSREGVTELAEDDNKARRISAGSLLMSFKLTIGRMAFAGCDLFPNEAIVAITPDEVSASRDFLYLNLGSRDLTEGSGQAVKGKTLNSKSLRAINIHLPPLEEQRRIVDLVGSIDTYIDRLETQIDTTRTARSALLSELLSNPSDDWQETTLGEIADWFAGGTPKATNPAFYTDGQIPWAVIADLLNDPVVETAKQINEDGLNAIGGRLAPVRSILVSMYGTIARTAIAGVPLATNQAIAWAEPHSDACDGGFLRLLVDRLQPAFESAARGAAQKNINRGMIKDAGVLLPPLAEQRQILDLIGSIDEQISSLESQVESVRALRSGVLSELLSGERLLDESYDMAVGL